jgi:hypothetical protein
MVKKRSKKILLLPSIRQDTEVGLLCSRFQSFGPFGTTMVDGRVSDCRCVSYEAMRSPSPS